MSFSDWIFYTRVTESEEEPSDITYTLEDLFPLAGEGSLRVHDHGAPAIATVAFMPDPLLFDTRIEAGHIRMIFDRIDGPGFLDHGFFFLSQGADPTQDNVVVYAVYLASGGTSIRLMKYTNGLHDNSSGTLLFSHLLTSISHIDPAVLDIAWDGGLLTRTTGYTRMYISYGANTTDFAGLTNHQFTVDDTDNPLFAGIGPGVFIRSRNASEPIYSMIDNTEIYRYDVA